MRSRLESAPVSSRKERLKNAVVSAVFSSSSMMMREGEARSFSSSSCVLFRTIKLAKSAATCFSMPKVPRRSMTSWRVGIAGKTSLASVSETSRSKPSWRKVWAMSSERELCFRASSSSSRELRETARATSSSRSSSSSSFIRSRACSSALSESANFKASSSDIVVC